MREMDITDILRGKSSKDCQCCAYGACECACDVTWPEQVAVEAADEIDRLRAELAGKEKALSAAKTVIEAKDKAYALIDQRFAAMSAKAATTDSERECNERLTAEIDALTAELAEARRLLDEARKQEPVAHVHYHKTGGNAGIAWSAIPTGVMPLDGKPLYAAPVPAQPAMPSLSVVYGPMPESNGKSNFTAILCRDGNVIDGYTIARSEYPDRVRYESDLVRHIIGELPERPSLLDYDVDKHSGYKEPPPAVPDGFGLPITQEPKYTTNAQGRLVNRATGEPIPDDEPVFIFRAKDTMSISALANYGSRLQVGTAHYAAVMARVSQFSSFKHDHASRMRDPDTALLAASKEDGT